MDCSLDAVNWHAHMDLRVVGILLQWETMSSNDVGEVCYVQNVQEWAL